MSGPVLDLAVAGDHAYAACGDSAFQVVDIGDPGTLEVVAEIASPAWAVATLGGGSYLLVAAGVDGVRTIDISLPASPAMAGRLDTSAPALGLAASGLGPRRP